MRSNSQVETFTLVNDDAGKSHNNAFYRKEEEWRMRSNKRQQIMRELSSVAFSIACKRVQCQQRKTTYYSDSALNADIY